MSIAEDIKFAKEWIGTEFNSISQALRYVAAINPQATRKEFIAACVEAGISANTAGNRFHESRTFDVAENEMIWNKDGTLSEKE